jgi:hypothetical protein
MCTRLLKPENPSSAKNLKFKFVKLYKENISLKLKKAIQKRKDFTFCLFYIISNNF